MNSPAFPCSGACSDHRCWQRSHTHGCVLVWEAGVWVSWTCVTKWFRPACEDKHDLINTNTSSTHKGTQAGLIFCKRNKRYLCLRPPLPRITRTYTAPPKKEKKIIEIYLVTTRVFLLRYVPVWSVPLRLWCTHLYFRLFCKDSPRPS